MGATSQQARTTNDRRVQKSKTRLLAMIWKKRTTKLIKTPAQSCWPYMGRKIFFIQTERAKDFSLSAKKFFKDLRAAKNPPEYHQSGK